MARTSDEVLEQNKETQPWKITVNFTGPDAIPAGGSVQVAGSVDGSAHFVCESITGHFTTLSGGVDVGTNVLTIMIQDAGNSVPFFDRPVPADLLLKPGRVLSPGVAGDPSNQLWGDGLGLDHTFRANTSIPVTVFSQAVADVNTLSITFHGRKEFIKVGT